MKMQIPARDGLEVFVNQNNTITILQSVYGSDDQCVSVHPDDIPLLISFLEKARQIAPDHSPEDVDNE